MIAGAVLTGGKSSRYGKDKCQETFNGKPLVEIAYLKLKEVVNKVYIVGKDYGIGEFLPDPKPHMGPLYALYGLLKKSTGYNGFLLLPCDMPLVPVGLLKFIAIISADYDIVVPRHKGLCEPLVAYYSTTVCSHAESLVNSGQLSLRKLFNLNLKIRVLEEELMQFGDPEKYFVNINYPEDLFKLTGDKI